MSTGSQLWIKNYLLKISAYNRATQFKPLLSKGQIYILKNGVAKSLLSRVILVVQCMPSDERLLDKAAAWADLWSMKGIYREWGKSIPGKKTLDKDSEGPTSGSVTRWLSQGRPISGCIERGFTGEGIRGFRLHACGSGKPVEVFEQGSAVIKTSLYKSFLGHCVDWTERRHGGRPDREATEARPIPRSPKSLVEWNWTAWA